MEFSGTTFEKWSQSQGEKNFLPIVLYVIIKSLCEHSDTFSSKVIFLNLWICFLILLQYLIGSYTSLRLMPFSSQIETDKRITICKPILK